MSRMILLILFLSAKLVFGAEGPSSGLAGPKIDVNDWKESQGVPADSSMTADELVDDESSLDLIVALQDNDLVRLRLAKEFLKSQLEFDQLSLKHRIKTLEWQYVSTQIIFWLVVMIVIMGVGMSYRHFLEGEVSMTKISIGKAGIEFGSRLVGVVVLFLSLLFFYLYLTEVYPVREIVSGKAESARGGSSASEDE